MQLSELRAQVRRHLAEASTDVFPDPLIDLKLNRAQGDLCGRWALIQTPASFAFSGPFLTMPINFIHPGEDKPKVNGVPLQRIDLSDLMMRDPLALTSSSQGGTTTHYVYEESLALNGNANTIGLWPVSVGTLSLTYVSRPNYMTADTDVPWNGKYEAFHEIIAMSVANTLQVEQGSSAAANTVFYSIFMKRKEEFGAYLSRGKIGKKIVLRSLIGKGGWQR